MSADGPLFDWRPPQKVVPFPSVHRRAMIERTAVAASSCRNPENTIAAALTRVRTSHARKGLTSDQINQDMIALEKAIRSTVAALLARQGRSA